MEYAPDFMNFRKLSMERKRSKAHEMREKRGSFISEHPEEEINESAGVTENEMFAYLQDLLS